MNVPVRTALRTLAVGAAGCSALLGGQAVAAAEPPANCSAADLARISAGVSNATADYLFSKPDVNAFFTGLEGQGPDELSVSVENYLNANPQVRDELQGIRVPLADFKTRCL